MISLSLSVPSLPLASNIKDGKHNVLREVTIRQTQIEERIPWDLQQKRQFVNPQILQMPHNIQIV
jgi:hypothetical protein